MQKQDQDFLRRRGSQAVATLKRPSLAIPD